MDDNINSDTLDYDDDLDSDAPKFSIERDAILGLCSRTGDGYLLKEDGLYLTPEACIRLSLDLYLGFPSQAVSTYYLWAQDYLIEDERGTSHRRDVIEKLWKMLRKEHISYWCARYYMARDRGRSEEKVRSLYMRLKIVHACRTVCRIVLNSIDGRNWCAFIGRFLKYREVGLQDLGLTDLGQGSGQYGATKRLKG